MAEVLLRNLVKRYDQEMVVRSINLEVADGEFVVLVGPSGCGKSTTLRMLAGLEEVTDGEILIGGRLMNFVPPKDRNVAMVFQSYALYPHMTVAENMSFSLRLRKVDRSEVAKRVGHAADILGISQLLDRRPRQLSGGQRQRVAMGRAIVRDPEVFLFDEPLSNLDAKLRVKMRTEIKRIHSKVGTTTVYVTHDQTEALTLADRVVVMNVGKIEQVGPPIELYQSPKTRFVATFIGSPAMNIIPCQLVHDGETMTIRCGGAATFPVPNDRKRRYAQFAGREMLLGIRPEHLSIRTGDPRHHMGIFKVLVDVVEPLGTETMIFFTLDEDELCARIDPELHTSPGEVVELAINLDKIHLIDPASNEVV